MVGILSQKRKLIPGNPYMNLIGQGVCFGREAGLAVRSKQCKPTTCQYC